MSRQPRRVRSIESLEQRQLMAADVFDPIEPSFGPSPGAETEPAAMIFVKIPTLKDDSLPSQPAEANELAAAPGGQAQMIADSFAFAVEREMKESDAPTSTSATDAAFAQMGDDTDAYVLDRVFVKSWTISGDADERPTEEVAFYYNKIAMNYARTSDGSR